MSRYCGALPLSRAHCRALPVPVHMSVLLPPCFWPVWPLLCCWPGWRPALSGAAYAAALDAGAADFHLPAIDWWSARSWARLRDLGQWTIGGALGLYFTPAVTELVAGLWWAIALAIAWALLLGWVFGRWLYRVQAPSMLTQPDMDEELAATTLFLGGDRCGLGDDRCWPSASMRAWIWWRRRSLRLVIVTVSIPFALQWSGLQGDPGLTLPSVRTVHGRLCLAGAVAPGHC